MSLVCINKGREGFFMYITSPKRKNGSTVVRLVESFWKEGKVKNRIVKTIGQSKEPKNHREI